jgi:hypothetical protein
LKFGFGHFLKDLFMPGKAGDFKEPGLETSSERHFSYAVLRRIISGGQSGADRAGLDFAIEAGLAHGGYVPKGRKAEDGRIDEKYRLTELATNSYPERTKRNVRESDGTVIRTPNSMPVF